MMNKIAILFYLMTSLQANGQSFPKEDVEPILNEANAIALIQESSLKGWEVPSAEHWSIEKGTIIGDTKGEKFSVPQWLYTKQSMSDFTFTMEIKLTGEKPNSGIYFRAKKVNWKGRYEAAVGYEYDVAEDVGFNGSIGDYFARPKFRIRADQALVNKLYNKQQWNRVTLRARGNRFEYWMNGIKIQDYRDEDPKGSLEGVIGIQLHNAKVMKLEFRNAYYMNAEQ
jgi:hypothetical protein